jgi:hypothetical protein
MIKPVHMKSIYRDDVVYESITDDDIVVIYICLFGIVICFVRYKLFQENR